MICVIRTEEVLFSSVLTIQSYFFILGKFQTKKKSKLLLRCKQKTDYIHRFKLLFIKSNENNRNLPNIKKLSEHFFGVTLYLNLQQSAYRWAEKNFT